MFHRRLGVIAVAVVALLAVGALQQSDVFAGPPDSATVDFGTRDVGSPFPPGPSQHDKSGYAKDKLVPRTVVISVGGTVTFNSAGVHQVAIYEPGTNPSDIDTSVTTAAGGGCPPVPLINDSNDREALLDAPECAGGSLTPSYTFSSPGKYLVICTFLPHFTDADMYGWVIVK